VPPASHPEVTPVKYVGIDVHKKMCQVAVLDDDGELLDETRFMNTPEGIEEFAMRLSAYRDEVRAVVESTENLWIQVHDRLEEHGFDVSMRGTRGGREGRAPWRRWLMRWRGLSSSC